MTKEVKAGTVEAKAIIEACMRLKPDHIILAELRVIDVLNAIKTGHPGAIAGNPAHARSNATMNAILQNCSTKIVLNKNRKKKH